MRADNDISGGQGERRPGLSSRLQNYYKRNVGRVLFRRPFAIQSELPLISFTFDDFPRSALLRGGAILKSHGLGGTYYVALGLLGTEGPSGTLFDAEDLWAAVADGHELGCHTYAHCHSWDTNPDVFEASVIENRAALKRLIPNVEMRSLSYPISEPRPLTKLKSARHFDCCRGGGQTFNTGTVDLNRLSCYFLEQSRGNLQAVKDLIDKNDEARGWLIFATHDVADNASRFGCTPEFFESVVQYSANSGASILPVAKALKVLQSRNRLRESVQ